MRRSSPRWRPGSPGARAPDVVRRDVSRSHGCRGHVLQRTAAALLTVACVGTALLGDLLGSVRPVAAEETWERQVERAKREQDRHRESAQRRGQGPQNVLRRYRQRCRDKDDALNNYLLGRAHWYGARSRIALRRGRRESLSQKDLDWIESETNAAVSRMQRALQLDPKFYFSELALAVIEMTRNDLPAAERHIANLRRIKPDLPDGIHLHAELLLARNDTRGIEPAMLRLLKANPADHKARQLLVEVYVGSRQWQKALAHIEKLLESAPTEVELRILRIDCQIGLGRWAAAENGILTLQRVMGESPMLVKRLVDCYAGREDWAAALRETERLIRLLPKSWQARTTRVGILMATQSWEAAVQEIDAIRSLAAPEAWKQIGPTFLLQRGLALVQSGRFEEAAKGLEALRAQQADAPEVLGLLQEVYIQLGRHEEAVETVRALQRLVPKDWRVRAMLAEALLGAGKWEEMLTELDAIRGLISDEDWEDQRPIFLFQRGFALMRLERFEEALVPLQEVHALRGDALQVMGLMQQILGRLQRPAARLEILEQMLPLVRAPQAKENLRELIRRLKAGEAIGGPPEELWPQDAVSDLLERCLHVDPEVRRKALFEYLQADLPYVDPLIYKRYHPSVEEDEQCRIWVVRILGKYRVDVADPETVREAARYVAVALEDPTSGVRKVAADELGHLGTPAGFLYLGWFLASKTLDPLPESKAERKDLEEEYNAARLALSALTGRVDTLIGASSWVPPGEMARNREGWHGWFKTPAGVRMHLAALADLAKVGNVGPRWALRYILNDLMRPGPDEIAAATYRVLRDKIGALGAGKIAADSWWRTFPLYDDAQLEAKGDSPQAKAAAERALLSDLRKKIRAWWAQLPKKAASPAKKDTK